MTEAMIQNALKQLGEALTNKHSNFRARLLGIFRDFEMHGYRVGYEEGQRAAKNTEGWLAEGFVKGREQGIQAGLKFAAEEVSKLAEGWCKEDA